MKQWIAQQETKKRTSAARRGSLVPLFGVTILVVGAALALVLDRLWIDAAQLELRTVAEASALAAGRDYIQSDSNLRTLLESPKENSSQQNIRIEKARAEAARIASGNLVAGKPLKLNTDEGGDIRFGRPYWGH